MKRLYLIVPVLNEAPNMSDLVGSFRKLAEELPEYAVTVILVDDGSTDGTASAARTHAGQLEMIVVSHPKNRGPGAAFATGFEYLASVLETDDWVVTIEGDNTSRRETLHQMLNRTREGYDVVLASPYMYGGGIANTVLHRTFLSHVANLFVKEALGIRGILTMSSFYRLYRAPVILKLQEHYGARIVERPGFECMIELLLKMIYLNVSISEVPMVLDTSRRKGASKMKVARTIRGYITLWMDKQRWRNQAR